LGFSVIKDFKFGERFSLQLRGEFFNILNHPNSLILITICRTGPTLGVGAVHARHLCLKSGDWLRGFSPYSGGGQNHLARAGFEGWGAPQFRDSFPGVI
jgi:hypothetical protein